ncbi:PEP-CTERM sorting domain-containing protein [Noviherbaspirillum pedocola]|uniref:PEP-CTERM sorting domain-containing protein n=1 Tax=Noviherbaspirillum pedocola TaxID=2801341 RepID=A0A934W257_9BURK|nr:PEP-CTERM sorting domain-containing protein [Noviherbaspirillum pedocola]MBK4735941.1 PEP-CTERM sorting domain-containing protein [Noviherbaspirillum pedocola]
MKKLLASMFALSLTAIGSSAHASIIVYTTQSSFMSAISAPATDTFAGFTVQDVTSSPITRNVGNYRYTASATGDFFGEGTSSNPWLSTQNAGDTITFNSFTGAVSAIGGNFFDTNYYGSPILGNIILTATDSSGSVTQTIINAATDSYMGFVSSNTLKSLTVTPASSGAEVWATVDNLTLAKKGPSSNVPEPTSVALMGLGIAGLALASRKKQK